MYTSIKLTVMQTRDEVEGLHNCQEFSQPLECLYQAMQIQEKKFFYCFYNINLTFPRKTVKLFIVMALIKGEIRLKSCLQTKMLSKIWGFLA